MWGFGWKLMVSGILDNTWNQLYQVVVGKFYSPATLGQYSRANEYSSIFSSNLTAIIQRVTYPVLAEVQDDKERMVVAYRRIIKVTMFITAVSMILIGAMAEPLIYCLIGPQWHEAASYLPLICLTMSLYPLHAINLNMLQVQGRSDIYLVLEVIKKLIGIGPLCIGIFVNIFWMLVSGLFIGIISFFLNSYYSGKKLGYSSWMQIKDVAPSYIIAFFVAIFIYFLKDIPITYWIVLPIQLFLSFLLIVIICEKIKLSEYIDLKNIIIDIINKTKNRVL